MTRAERPETEIDTYYRKLLRDAETGGYHLNPDIAFTQSLVAGLLTNEKRYGYPSCPCRLGMGRIEEDTDIICPCDYRDPDLYEFGACYCALYVSEEVMAGEKTVGSIPERRPPPGKRHIADIQPSVTIPQDLPFPVFRCRVCGYLCARKNPPEVCPICRARRERFERFF
jgi:ferredoxin-thioredoxin reductase catalytic chain